MSEPQTAEGAVAGEELSLLVASLADNKLFLGRRYAEWCTAAPTLESAVAAAAMAQDEIGHARSLYPVLRDLSGVSPQTEPETRTAWTNAPFLGRPFAGWTDFVAANLLFDTALTVLLEASRESAYRPLAQRARRMLEEEPLHWLHAEGWTRRLACHGDGVRTAFLHSLGPVQVDALSWLGVARPALVAAAVVDAPADTIRTRFLARVNAVFDSAGLPTVQ